MLGKKHIILSALVLALGAAVYINWQFTGTKVVDASAEGEESGTIGAAQYVNTGVSEDAPTSDASSGSDTTESTAGNLSESGKNYFAEAKLTRQQAQDKAIEQLEDIVENTALSEKEKSDAVSALSALTKTMELEVKIENLIKAKGYTECLVTLENQKASVVISSPDGLLANETISINEIVRNTAGIPFSDITIIEVK